MRGKGGSGVTLGGLAMRPGLRVGLLGGSFDPPHAGHLHLSREALRRFRLDAVVWLVSPGNPLKTRAPAPLAVRLAAARGMIAHPRIVVSDVEERIGTRYTVETLSCLRARHPKVRFVWLMGADNLVGFHRWENWRQIAAMVPLGILARPGQRLAARTSRAARILAGHRLSAAQAPALAHSAPPAWCFVNMPMVDLSSTVLREREAG